MTRQRYSNSYQEQAIEKPTITPHELVSGVVRLVSLPEVCIRVNEMLDDPKISASDIGKIISQDPGLTARLLKIVNSAFYGFPSRIETVSRAVTVIGLRELRGLVLAASAVEAFSKIPNDVLNMVRFWRHSVYCGVVAKLLAQRCDVLHSERLFVAGLLHDIGKLIISHRLPTQAREILRLQHETDMSEIDVERQVLGFDHAHVGGELLKVWQMPKTLMSAVRYHHEPDQTDDAIIDTSLVHIANGMTFIAEQGLDAQGKGDEISLYAWQTTGLTPDAMDNIFQQAGELFTEALESILPRSYRPY